MSCVTPFTLHTVNGLKKATVTNIQERIREKEEDEGEGEEEEGEREEGEGEEGEVGGREGGN